MGAREELQDDLAEAFGSDNELGQAYAAFTAQRTTGGEYDPVTGGYSSTTLTYAGHYWRDSFTFAELETLDLGTADIKIGILANATEQMPQVDDEITLADGSKARVVSVSPDPLGATYAVHLRIN